MPLSRYRALVATEFHGRSLYQYSGEKPTANFSLAKLYNTPLSWKDIPDQQLAEKSLAQLLEMQNLAPGVTVRYLIGARIEGVQEVSWAGNSKLILSFGWSGCKEEKQLALFPTRIVVDRAVFNSKNEQQFDGPKIPFDSFSLTLSRRADLKNFIISYGAGVLVTLASGSKQDAI